MHNNKILLASDLHLMERTYTSLDLNGDSFYSFEQIIDYAVENKIPTIGLLGDVINVQRPSSVIVEVLLRNLRRAFEAGIKVLVIQGQHDLSKPPWLTIQSYAEHAHNKIYKIGKHSLLFLDYTPRAELQQAIADLPPNVTVFCAHQSTKEVLNFGDDDIETRSWDFELCDMPEHVKYVFLGDIHENTELLECDSGTLGMYCGSTHMCRYTEPPNKHFLVVDCSDDELQITKVPLATRPFCHIKLMDADDLQQFTLAQFTSILSDAKISKPSSRYPDTSVPLVVIEYIADLPSVYEHITNICSMYASKHKIYLKLVSRIRRTSSSDNEVKLSYVPGFEDSVTAGLELLVDPDSQSSLFGMCKDLLQAGDDEAIKSVLANFESKLCQQQMTE